MQNLLPPKAAVIAERNKDLFSFLISFSFKLNILGGVCFVLKICNKRVKSVREKKKKQPLSKKKKKKVVFCFSLFHCVPAEQLWTFSSCTRCFYCHCFYYSIFTWVFLSGVHTVVKQGSSWVFDLGLQIKKLSIYSSLSSRCLSTLWTLMSPVSCHHADKLQLTPVPTDTEVQGGLPGMVREDSGAARAAHPARAL